ncbi:MAG TPA: DUF362 domain-containing protein [Candidatus Goldiibacteriota bacterium]|nr:DUF362 domain-containing protein [Candidatus Goldiibacteriota bacterium]
MSDIVVKKCGRYDIDEIRVKMEQGFDLLGGIGKFINKGETVLIKPNSLTAGGAATGVNTHPVFLQAAIQVIKKQAGRVLVGDSPGGPGSFTAACKSNGMGKVIKEEGAEAVDLSGEEHEIFSQEKLIYKSFKVDKLIGQVDRIVNLPKIKTHTLMIMTMAVKNMFGIIPGMKKMEYHMKAGHDRMLFAKVLVDLYSARPPEISIMDGIRAMQGNGPGSEGEMVDFGVILMGADAFALDAAAATMAGIDPYSIYTNEVCRKYILKRADIEYSIRGDRIDGVLRKLKLPAADLKSRVPAFVYKAVKGLATTKPYFVKEKCTGCLICLRHCPVTALRYEGKAKGIKCDYDRCIRCFVCHELCPEKAITVKNPPLGFLFKAGVKK